MNKKILIILLIIVIGIGCFIAGGMLTSKMEIPDNPKDIIDSSLKSTLGIEEGKKSFESIALEKCSYLIESKTAYRDKIEVKCHVKAHDAKDSIEVLSNSNGLMDEGAVLDAFEAALNESPLIENEVVFNIVKSDEKLVAQLDEKTADAFVGGLMTAMEGLDTSQFVSERGIYGIAFDCIGKSFSDLEKTYGQLERLDYSEGSLYFTAPNDIRLGFQYVGDGNPPEDSLCSSFIGSLDTVFNVPSNTSLNQLAEMLEQDFDESSLEYYSDVPYLNVVIWNISYDGREYKVMVGYDENHNIGDVTLFCESFAQPADTGHSMFDETIWTCARGQSLGGQSLIKFHADETFSEYLYGADEMISDAGTWFYDSINDTLYINDTASPASSEEEVYTKDGDSFRSIDPVEMMVGEDYMWIRPGTDDQGIFN